MTQKREPFLIDLMDDTDSDSADAPKKLGKRLRNWPVLQEFIDEVFDVPFPHDFENPDCDPFAPFKQRSGHRKFEGAAQVLGHKSEPQPGGASTLAPILKPPHLSS